jgi:PAS domain S-box-containing protein
VTVSPRHDENGRVVETIAIAEDITRERAAEQQRRLQQSLLEVASRVGRLGAWSFSIDSRELYLSDELHAILGVDANQARNRETLFGAFAPEYQPRVQGAVRACSTEGRPFDMEARLTTVQGTGRWVRVIGEAVREGGGRIVAIRGALQDITDRKFLEQQSLRSQRLESIGTLAGGIAHDLNNVLTPIAMGVGLLKAGERDHNRLQLLGIIESSAARAASMVQQVLSFARGAEGQRTRVSPAHLIAEMTPLLRDTLPKQIQLDVDAGHDVWPIEVDPTQIHQVLLNLCVNSRDAMPRGGMLRIEIRNVVLDVDAAHASGVVAAGDYVRITVEDTGEGIAADVIDKIFDPFFTTKPTGRGTGLGLSTSLGIVQSHGGHIDVTSTKGLGSRFDVLIPAARQSGQPAPAPAHEQRAPSGRGTVLLVDDEVPVRLMAREVLERSGYHVLEAAGGEEALSIYRAQQPAIAVVVTDIMMPGMDGADLVRAIRGLSENVPIIGMSGVAGSERQSAAERWGLSGFLQKPYPLDALRDIVHRAVNANGASI